MTDKIYLYLCMKKKLSSGLLLKILVAIIIGIGVGYVSPEWLARLCATFNGIFSQFLTFLIPLIIFGFVTPAIADLGKRAGNMLIATVIVAYLATLFAGFVSYFTGTWLFPQMLAHISTSSAIGQEASAVMPYFEIKIPAITPVMTSLVLSFVTGLGIAFVNGDTLRKCVSEFRNIVSLTITKCVIPLLPIYIFGIFVTMTYDGQVGTIIHTFLKIIIVIFVLHVLLLLFQFCVASLFAGKNPLKMLWTMMPAYFTALGTQSSAATIPVTLRQTIKMGVDEDVAGFVVPLCATIHMSGSTLKIVACALALMIMQGIPYSAGEFAQFIAMIGVTIIAAPGIPGGAIMASLGLLSSILGFSDAQNAMMIALYIAMDSFGTACNVTGDGAIAAIINKFFGQKTSRG